MNSTNSPYRQSAPSSNQEAPMMASTPTSRPRFYSYWGASSYPRPRSSAAKPNPNYSSGYGADEMYPGDQSYQSESGNSSYSTCPEYDQSYNSGYGSQSQGYSARSTPSSVNTKNQQYTMQQSGQSYGANSQSYGTSSQSYGASSQYDQSYNTGYESQTYSASALQSSQSSTDTSSMQQQQWASQQVQQENPSIQQIFTALAQSNSTMGGSSSAAGRRGGGFKKFPRKRKAPAPQLNLRCELCDLDFGNQIPLDMHLQGAKHSRKAKALEILKEMEAEGSIKVGAGQNVYQCELCNVVVNSPDVLQVHYNGAKHKNKLAKASGEDIPVSEKDTVKSEAGLKVYQCELCNVVANSPEMLQLHFTGAKHKNKLAVKSSGNGTGQNGAEGKNSYTCELCKVTVNHPDVIDMHYKGAKHRNKLANKDKIVTLTEGKSVQSASGLVVYQCELCNVIANNPDMLQLHFDGAKHKHKLANKDRQPDGPPPAKIAKTYNCSVCDISLNSEAQLNQHLESKKHEAKLTGQPLEKKFKKKRKFGKTSEASTEEMPMNTDDEMLMKLEPKSIVPPLSSTFVQSKDG